MNSLGKSKVVSESTAITDKAACILGVAIKAGTDSATVFLTDGADSASDKKIATLPVGTGNFDYIEFTNGIQCSTGIYAEISGTAPEVAVIYED